MNKSRWIVHPITVLIFSVIAVCASLFLYIYWYVEVSVGIQAVIEKAGVDHDLVFTPQTWVVILVLSVLVSIILIGISVIFTYNQKIRLLYSLQRNFINNFTHELRIPVTSIKLYLETFSRHRLPRRDQMKYLEYMIQDTDRLSNNINHILSLAKIENRTLKGNFTRENLVSFIDKFVDENRYLYQELEININNPSGREYEYDIDVSLFGMMLMNLLNNAIKYSRVKTPRMDIAFTPRNRKLHIEFKDNGIGLPRKEARKVFRKFYQIRRADGMSVQGTGLGLYLVDNIARLHKGKVRAFSPGVGKGSVFSVILPLKG